MEWFKDWFNSKYYHLLYGDRDIKEAEIFINNLLNFLPLKNGAALEACCGKGRHAIQLAKHGWNTTAFDYASESIEYAKQFENEMLHFFQHDIRYTIASNQYDLVTCLFTSLGYFKTNRENEKAIHTLCTALKPNGFLVIDYLNAIKVNDNLVKSESKIIDNIEFKISRKLENNAFIKTTKFNDDGNYHSFTEHVKAYKLTDFENMLEVNNCTIQHVFGSYDLTSFDESNSNRLIIIAIKK